MEANEPTILGSLRTKQAEPALKKRKKKQRKEEAEMSHTENLRKRNIDMLSQQLCIEEKLKEENEDEIIEKELGVWLKSLNTVSLDFVDREEEVPSHYDIDLQKFQSDYLKKESKEKQDGKESEGFALRDEQNDIAIDEDCMEEQLLGKKQFEEYEYRNKLKTVRYKTDGFVYDYSTRTDKKIFDITDMTRTTDSEMTNILENGVDLFIVDPLENSYTKYTHEVCSYIARYCLEANEIRQQNKETRKEDEEAELEKVNGYVRPRVLVLLNYRYEFKELALRFYNITGRELKPEVVERFDEEFESEDNAYLNNVLIGLSLTEKSIQVNKKLKHCDIIFANPSFLLEKHEELESILSSIELLYIHRFSQFHMQDFSVFRKLFSKMNCIPDHKEVDQDFTTIRPAFLANMGKFMRQTIVYTESNSMEQLSLLNKFCCNYKGILKGKVFYPKPSYPSHLNFIFKKIKVNSLATEFEDRFNYFCSQIWSEAREKELYQGSIIFVNNYLLYKRLQKYLKSKHSPVGFISEHTPKNKVQSAYVKFNTGQYKYLLVTERALFFEIYQPKRYTGLIFYNLPYNYEIFEKLYKNMETAAKNELIILFNRKDKFELEKLIGTTKSTEFLSNSNNFRVLRFN